MSALTARQATPAHDPQHRAGDTDRRTDLSGTADSPTHDGQHLDDHGRLDLSRLNRRAAPGRAAG